MARTILVVDDDADTREAIAEVLLLNGFEVALAQDGREALSILGSQRPSAILLDLIMPGMDGAEFRTAQLRDPRLAHIPFVLMTGRTDLSAVSRALGAKACLRKPIMPSDLLRALAQSSSS